MAQQYCIQMNGDKMEDVDWTQKPNENDFRNKLFMNISLCGCYGERPHRFRRNLLENGQIE